MKPDLNKLRVLAEAATPGPWHSLRCGEMAADDESCCLGSRADMESWEADIVRDNCYDECSHMFSRADAEFIAAANPETMLALLDDLAVVERMNRSAEEQWMRVHTELENLRKEYTRGLVRCPICEDGGAMSKSWPDDGTWPSYTCLNCDFKFRDD